MEKDKNLPAKGSGDDDKECQEDDNKEAPILPDEIIEKFPPEDRKQIQRIFSSMVVSGYSGPMQNPLARKLNEGHITKIIDNTEKEDQRLFQNAREERKVGLTVFFGILIPVVGLLVFFTLSNKIEVLIPMLSALVGFGGGYGIGRTRS